MFFVVAALALTAQPAAPATPPAPPQGGQMMPPPAFMTSAQAFGQCVGAAIRSVPATVAPEAGATQALTSCATQKGALETQFEAWVSSASFPAEGREMARAQFRERLGGAQAQIAEGIRQSRAAPAAPPAPTPR